MLKIGLSVFEAAIALGVLMYAHHQLIRDWNRRALLVLVTIYVVGGGLIFHALSLHV